MVWTVVHKQSVWPEAKIDWFYVSIIIRLRSFLTSGVCKRSSEEDSFNSISQILAKYKWNRFIAPTVRDSKSRYYEILIMSQLTSPSPYSLQQTWQL